MDQYLLFNAPGFPLLSALMLLPLAGAAVCLFIRNQLFLKYWGLAVTTAAMVLSLPLYFLFDRQAFTYQFAEIHPWIPALNLSYVVGIDGISLPLLLLTTGIMPLCVLCSWRQISERLGEFFFLLLLMESAMIGVFISLNIVLFYIFWEGMLIPLYLLIAVWGGARRDYASIKFFLYTFVGSVFLLLVMIVLYVTTESFFIPELMQHRFPFSMQLWIFAGCAIAFAIKIPMYPLHTWLPAAHVEAPTAGSVILAAVLLKMGGYGFLRFCLPMAPAATLYCAPAMIGLSVAAIIIGGYLALGQSDIKRLIAYSSVAHMGFVTLGIFLLTDQGLKGAVLQMVNHGISTGALFICVGIIYERTHSRELSDNRALGMVMPLYVTFLGIFSLSSFGFPGTNGFIGEFLIVIAAFAKYALAGFLVVPGVVLSAAYMLRMLQKMIWADSDGHYPPTDRRRGALPDINLREFLMLAVLAVFVFLIGLKPSVVLDVLNTSANHLYSQVAHSAGRN